MTPVQMQATGELAGELKRAPSILDLPNQGLHFEVPAEQYYRRVWGVASNSGLNLVHRAPSVWLEWMIGIEQPETPALFFGTAFHTAVLEPERFARLYVIEPNFGDCRRKAPRQARDAWRAEHTGSLLLDSEQWRRITGMREALMDHPEARRLCEAEQREVTGRWEDAETGLICKMRMDLWLPRIGAIGDLKSTEDARPEAFQRSIAKFGYFRQHAMYVEGARECGVDAKRFAMVAVEKEPPHLVAAYTLAPAAVERGARQIRRLLRTLAECLETDNWPGLPHGIHEIDLPRWYDEDE